MFAINRNFHGTFVQQMFDFVYEGKTSYFCDSRHGLILHLIVYMSDNSIIKESNSTNSVIFIETSSLEPLCISVNAICK